MTDLVALELAELRHEQAAAAWRAAAGTSDADLVERAAGRLLHARVCLHRARSGAGQLLSAAARAALERDEALLAAEERAATAAHAFLSRA